MHRPQRVRLWLLSGFAILGAIFIGVSPLGFVAGEAPVERQDPFVALLGLAVLAIAVLIFLGEALLGRRRKAETQEMRVV